MKFDSLLDFRLFIKSKLDNIIDEDFKAKLLACQDYYIPNDLYYVLNDSFNNYINQIGYYNYRKTFFKNLLKDDELTYEHLPALSSFNTHLYVCLNERLKIRNNVDFTDFKLIKSMVDNMINKIIEKGIAKNEIKKYYV